MFFQKYSQGSENRARLQNLLISWALQCEKQESAQFFLDCMAVAFVLSLFKVDFSQGNFSDDFKVHLNKYPVGIN